MTRSERADRPRLETTRRERVVAGTRTVSWESGDPSDPVVVAVHGLRGTHHGLLPVMGRLTGHRVVVPDLPGFGESAPLAHARHGVAGYRAWLEEFLGQVAGPTGALGAPVVLVGHSFGSVLATAATAGGAPVRALVLLNPITEARPGRRVGALVGTLAHRAAAALPGRAGAALLRSSLLTRHVSSTLMTTTDPDLRRWIHEEHRRHFGRFADPRVLREAFEAAAEESIDSYAAQVDVPTTLLVGDRDLLAPLADQRTLVGRFPDAELAVLPHVGHLAHYEAPDAVAALVAGAASRAHPTRDAS